METLPQHLRRNPGPSVKREGKQGQNVTWTSYLNKPVDVMTCDSIEGHPREDLKILDRDNPMSPVHCQPLITPDGGRTRVSLFLLLPRQTRLFGDWSWKLFNRSWGWSCPRRLRTKDDGVMEVAGTAKRPFLVIHTIFFPMFDNGSSFFALILAYMSLLNLVIISARGKSVEKKCMLKKYKGSTDELNTYSFFLQY